jgi:hypothetical protein
LAQLGLGFFAGSYHHYSAVENPANKNLNLIINCTSLRHLAD